MADTTISPNMGLPLPTVSECPGPNWATDNNACLTAIDSHNHSSGQGVPITPDGLNISSDLPVNDNNITDVRSLRLYPQVSTPGGAADLGCLYENGVDLYYIDGAGNDIRITQSGSVTGSSGTITGLPSGTASAAFAAGTFTFQQATNTPASMNFGPTTIGQAVVSGYGVTISANAGQAANYALGLPVALPAATQFVTLDASGNIGASIPTALGIDTSNIASGAVTKVKLAAVGQQISSSCGAFTTVAGTYVSVTNLSVTITTIGRPVVISMVPVGSSASPSGISGSGTTITARFRLISNAGGTTEIGVINFTNLLSAGVVMGLAPTFYDVPAAGTYTYTIQATLDTGTGPFAITNYSLFAYEL